MLRPYLHVNINFWVKKKLCPSLSSFLDVLIEEEFNQQLSSEQDTYCNL